MRKCARGSGLLAVCLLGVGACAPSATAERTSGERGVNRAVRLTPPPAALDGFAATPRGWVAPHGDFEASVDGAGAHVVTQGVERGALRTVRVGSIDARPEDRVERDPTGAIALRHGAAIERIESTPTGWEQSWRFDQRPVAGGDLVVEVAAPAWAFEAESHTAGLTLASRDGAVRMRYGHGTWVDARGARHAVPARWSDGVIRLSVPAEVVAASAYPAVLDPTVSIEVRVYGPATSGRSLDPILQPVTAVRGTVVMSAWADRPLGASPPDVIRLARWSTLDDETQDADFALTPIGTAGRGPLLSASRDGFLVLWQRLTGTVADVVGVRLSAAGDPLDAAPRVFFRGSDFGGGGVGASALAFDGVNNVVALGANGVDLRLARIAPDGTVLDPMGVVVAPPAGFGAAYSGPVTLSAAPSSLVTSWFRPGSSFRDLQLRRVSADLRELGPVATITDPVAPASTQQAASDGVDHLVAWSQISGGVERIRVARVSGATGAVLHDGVAFMRPYEVSVTLRAVIGRSDGYTLMMGTAFADLPRDAMRAGAPLPVPFGVGTRTSFSAGWNGAVYAVAVFGAEGFVMSPTGTPGRRGLRPLYRGYSRVAGPLHAWWNGAEFLVGWGDDLGSYAQPLDAFGRLLEPAGRAFTGLVHGVAFRDGRAMAVTERRATTADPYTYAALPYDARLRTPGTARPLFDLRTRATVPAMVAGPGGGYAFLTVAPPGTPTLPYLALHRLGADGSLQGSTALVTTDTSMRESSFALAASGSQYLVAWSTSPSSSTSVVRARPVSAAGALLNEATLWTHELTEGLPILAIASDGTDFLVSSCTVVLAPNSAYVRTRRVFADGRVEASTTNGSFYMVGRRAYDLVYDGSRYIGAFTYNRGPGPSLGIQAFEVVPGVGVRSIVEFGGEPDTYGEVRLASDGAGRVLVAYQHTWRNATQPHARAATWGSADLLDAGPPDTAPTDGGPADATTPDGAPLDVARDASAPDAGAPLDVAPDLATTDLGAPAEAGLDAPADTAARPDATVDAADVASDPGGADGGIRDATASDAADAPTAADAVAATDVLADAATDDAVTSDDGRVAGDVGAPPTSASCGCRTTSRAPTSPALAALALAALASRARRRTSRLAPTPRARAALA